MIRTPTRKLHLVQVGSGLVPRANAETEISYKTRQAFTDQHNGTIFDHYQTRREPFEHGQFKHTGLYVCCGTPCDCQYAIEEIDHIQEAKGVWTPMLFYTDVGVCHNPPAACLESPDCGLYLWAYGKVTEVKNVARVDDYLTHQVAEVGVSGILMTPLTEITWSRWRYGISPHDVAAQPLSAPAGSGNSGYSGRAQYIGQPYATPMRKLDQDVEEDIAEPIAEWYIPCGIPSQCHWERFWPRNLNDDTTQNGNGVEFDWTKWECRWSMVQSSPGLVVMVYGNTAPRVRAVLSGQARLQVRNKFGTVEYYYNRPPNNKIYTDSWTGVVTEQDVDGVLSPVREACPPVQMDWSENVISATQGWGVVGAVNCWVN